MSIPPGGVKLNLFRGTQHQIGYESGRFDRVVSRHITNVTDFNTRTGIRAGIEKVVSVAGTNHPDYLGNPVLPLQRASGQKFGDGKVLVTLVYARGRIQQIPEGTPDQGLAKFSTGYEMVEAYRDFFTFDADGQATGVAQIGAGGMPAGDLYQLSPEQITNINFRNHPRWYIRAPVVKIRVEWTTAGNPLGANQGLLDKLRTTNSAQVTLGDYLFSANTLRFDGISSDWIQDSNTPGGELFVSSYHFTARAGGHIKQTPRWSVNDLAWVTSEVDMYNRDWTASDFDIT